MLTHFRKISLFLAYLVATIPLWHYISEAHILLLMTSVVIFAYLNIVISSADAAKAVLSSEKAKTPLPRWLPQKPKYEKWWLIVRHTLKWHLLLVPAKMGLALGFMEWLHSGTGDSTKSILQPYFYNSFPFPAYPVWEMMLLGLGLMMLFTMLEGILVASLALLAKHPLKLIFLRILIVLSIIGITSKFQTFSPAMRGGRCLRGTPDVCVELRYFETVQTGLLILDDMGVLLTTNIMRPNMSRDPINRLFVLRQCAAGILGIFLYLGTTWAILCFMEDE